MDDEVDEKAPHGVELWDAAPGHDNSNDFVIGLFGRAMRASEYGRVMSVDDDGRIWVGFPRDTRAGVVMFWAGPYVLTPGDHPRATPVQCPPIRPGSFFEPGIRGTIYANRMDDARSLLPASDPLFRADDGSIG